MKEKLLALALIALVVGAGVPAAAAGEGVSVRYESQPDEAVIYLGDLVYARDAVSLPPGDVEVAFPANMIPDSLVVTEDDERVSVLRFRNRGASSMDALLSSRTAPVPDSAGPLVVAWPSEATETRQVVLEYLMRGAGWRPVYDMAVLDEESVLFSFSAEITDYALSLEEANVHLVSGMIATTDGGVYAAQMTVAQNALGYQNVVGWEAPAAEQVSAHHVYDIGAQTILPGEVMRIGMVSEVLEARRIIAWDTRQGERTDVIYKIANTSDLPFAEGVVRTYQDGVYLGSDYIEWTPTGSEGSVTVAGMSDVRVRRRESVEEVSRRSNYEYHHEVTLEIGNYSADDIEITVLDQWSNYAVDFTFSHEPTRQPGNVLRWDLTVPAGERVNITYEFYTD
jgi:hypothetical protein